VSDMACMSGMFEGATSFTRQLSGAWSPKTTTEVPRLSPRSRLG